MAFIRYVLDFDGTIVNDQGEHAAWRTDWTLVRTDYRHSAWQESAAYPLSLTIPLSEGGTKQLLVQLPETLEVSYGEYRSLRQSLATEDGRQLGTAIDPTRPVHLPQDPLNPSRPEWILPGFYHVDKKITYDRFQTIGRSFLEHPLLQDFDSALVREQLPEEFGQYEWRGPGFFLLQAALSDAQKLRRLSILTARGHEYSEVSELFERFKKLGAVDQSARDLEYTLIAIGDPANLPLLGKGSLAALKVVGLEKEARQLLYTPLPTHFELAADPRAAARGEYIRRQVLLYAEDDPIHIQNVGQRISDLSMRGDFKAKIKFVLYQSTVSDEFAPRWPQRWTVFHDGRGRPAYPEEIAQWSKGLEPQVAPTCESVLVSGGQ